jgi:hypothetical protein
MKSLEQVVTGLPFGQMLVGLKAVTELPKPPKAIVQLAREPRDRLVSMYEYFIGGERHPMPGMTQPEVTRWYDDTWGAQTMTFENFVLGLPKVIENHHFRPQHTEHGDLATLRWRLEDVNNFWRVLKIKVAPGLPMKFPHTNRTERSKPLGEYMDELSEEAYAVYRELYGEDQQFYRQALTMSV